MKWNPTPEQLTSVDKLLEKYTGNAERISDLELRKWSNNMSNFFAQREYTINHPTNPYGSK